MAVERPKSSNRLRECKRCSARYRTKHKYGKICSKCALPKSDYTNPHRVQHIEELLKIDEYLQAQKRNTQ